MKALLLSCFLLPLATTTLLARSATPTPTPAPVKATPAPSKAATPRSRREHADHPRDTPKTTPVPKKVDDEDAPDPEMPAKKTEEPPPAAADQPIEKPFDKPVVLVPEKPVVLIPGKVVEKAPEKIEEKPTLPPAATPAPKATPRPVATPTLKPSARTTPASSSASPRGEIDLDAPAQAAIAFFNSIQKNQIDEAYAILTKGSKIAERPEELKTLKAKTTEAVELFGAIHGYEMIESKPVGSNLLRRTYISLGRDFPLRWRFYFYRSSAEWRLVDLRVDDRLSGIFDEPEERAGDAKP